MLTFVFTHCKAVKVSQDDQIPMWRWFPSVFLMNGTVLRSFSHFQILTWIAYSDLSRNLGNWLILKFVFINCKVVNVRQNDQIQKLWWFTSVFLMNGTELRSYSHFQILTWIVYSDLSRNLQIDKFWSLSSFTVKQGKSVKMIKFKCNDYSEVFSWWMEKIKKFWSLSNFDKHRIPGH